MSAIGDVVVNLVTRNKTGPGISSALKDLGGFGKSALGLVGMLGGVGAGITAVGLAVGAARWGTGLAVEAEQAQIAFSTMLGSASAAKGLLSDLSKFAVETPYESPEVVAAGKQLLAYGFDAKAIIPTLTQL